MPWYDWKCPNDHTFGGMYPSSSCGDGLPCEKCGEPCKRLYTAPPAVHLFQPYYTEHLDAEPGKGRWIESRQQEDRTMKEQGLRAIRGDESTIAPGKKIQKRTGNLYFGKGMGNSRISVT